MRLDALERRVAMLESVVSGMQRLAAGDDEDPVDGPEPGFMRIDMPVTEQ